MNGRYLEIGTARPVSIARRDEQGGGPNLWAEEASEVTKSKAKSFATCTGGTKICSDEQYARVDRPWRL
jgi:hypothetical protein